MKRILIVSCVFPPEPVVSAEISKDLALALTKNGNEVTVVVPTPSRPAGFNFDRVIKGETRTYYNGIVPGVNVVHVNSKVSPDSNFFGRSQESYSFGMACAKFLYKRAATYDIVYINSWPILSQYLIVRSCKKLNIPYIIHVQDIYPESFSNKLPYFLGKLMNTILIPVEKYYLTNAKNVVSISDNMQTHLAKTRGLHPKKLVVVYNWQDEQAFELKSSGRVPDSRFTFMYLGNIGSVAGVETLIRAFHQANLPQCDLVIAGNGTSKSECIKLASTMRLSNVSFIEADVGEVPRIQNQADILLLPVIKGGALSSIPSKLPAYMFSSKPIIATIDAESDTAKAIIEAGCGWVGPPEDEGWLADKMRCVYAMDKEELKRLGNRGFKYGNGYLSKKANLRKLMNCIVDE